MSKPTMSKTAVSKTLQIREAFDRNRKAVELRPAIAQSTSSVTCRMIDGLTCEATDGRFKLVTDNPKSEGGEGRGPTPGFLIRAGLASCCAICYGIAAARLEVPIDSIDVEVESDFDARGLYGLAEVTHGFTEVRLTVHVCSAAPEADILNVIDTGDDMSPMLWVVRDPVTVKREVEISLPSAA